MHESPPWTMTKAASRHGELYRHDHSRGPFALTTTHRSRQHNHRQGYHHYPRYHRISSWTSLI